MFEVAVECSRCGKRLPINKHFMTVCPSCGGALLFQYDLTQIAAKMNRRTFKKRKDTFWKFIELLPISQEHIVSLGEPYTPILPLSTSHTGKLRNVYLKDDGRLPTGTFKARAMAVTVSKLKELQITKVAIPSAGNAASALAAYASAISIESHTFMPKDVPEENLKECAFLGAHIYLVDGLINQAAEALKKQQKEQGWVDISTNKQPYRFEGYKAAAFELAEQFNWNPPEHMFIPTGGGEGVIGLWKGFNELTKMGWINKPPSLNIVQSTGCAPLVEAYNRGQHEVQAPWKNPRTIAAGLRVPHPYASYLVLKAIRETKGMATAVEDKDIITSMKTLFKKGIYACPEAASTLAGIQKLQDQGFHNSDERSLLYITGTALKHLHTMKMEKSQILTK